MSKETMRVVIADDHSVVRQGIRGVLEQIDGLEVVGEAGDGAEAAQQRNRQPLHQRDDARGRADKDRLAEKRRRHARQRAGQHQDGQGGRLPRDAGIGRAFGVLHHRAYSQPAPGIAQPGQRQAQDQRRAQDGACLIIADLGAPDLPPAKANGFKQRGMLLSCFPSIPHSCIDLNTK